ncbi:translation initiation factor IF-3 [Paenibacillus sp. 1011MAR3C5]|uniref:translation initiation factor IF-3 n=1 Tax=Paenibacillus sp. 1011MAR3C5 TaxID=1675787 RepID=UPI000E6B6228|nr:translation initiation factor IF-3 [Paenibacillus sp. 1011MAR3C5]RJE84309.1 translation initiation factor IF-3 [Paenibacillus sp. 1011MAR3C5]
MASKLVMNEAIKAVEVSLTGLDGERIGVVSRQEALELAKQLKADLVCDSLMSSPPPCRLVSRGAAKQEKDKAGKEARQKDGQVKVKEIRLTASIEDHDYETKRRQAEKLLESGYGVLLVVRIQGKEGPAAKALLEGLATDLKVRGTRKTGVQLSGKQAALELMPK